jgi:uncharacterized protein (DUF924 family)
LAFWRQAGPERWFAADPAFDSTLQESFAALHDEAARGKLSSWEQAHPARSP